LAKGGEDRGMEEKESSASDGGGKKGEGREPGFLVLRVIKRLRNRKRIT